MLAGNISTVASGGAGYTVGDTLTVVGGTPTGAAATYQVTAVSGGVVTAFTAVNFAAYSVLPTNPVSVTGGTGSGATLNLVYSISPNFTITNAGSGYVEQPTVTFSGGGGSGAAAYARVGGNTSIRSLGTTIDFQTPGGTAFRISDTGSTGVSFWQALTGSSAILRSNSGNALLQTSDSNGLFLQTNGGITQAVVSHTASAVNFVQVTGAATGGRPTISTQGSDTNADLVVLAKGISAVNLGNSGQGWGLSVIGGTGSVNRLQASGSATGVAPVFSSIGSDTNIPLVLQPKGTGALQAQQTDSTATGGNARGANAVDWQTSRNAASQVASGQFSVISGGANNSSGAFASAAGGGTSNTARGNYNVVAGGSSNQADGNFNNTFSAICGGYSNVANGYLNFVGGGYGNSTNTTTAATTQSASITSGSTAVTLSGSNASIRVGQLIIATGINTFPPTYVAAISGTSLTLSQNATATNGAVTLNFFTPLGAVAGGGNNVASGSHSFVGGGGYGGTSSGGTGSNRATGDFSTVAGGSGGLASGMNSFIGGGGFGSGNGNTASGTSAVVAGGYNNSASGFTTVVVGGNGNTATGNFGVVGGAQNTNNAANGVIIGGQYGNARIVTGYHVFPACAAPIAAVSGVSQAALVILARQTTDATPTVLRSDTAAASTVNQVTLPNNSAYFFRGEVVAGVTGGGDAKGWTIEGVIKRGANAASTTLVGVTVTSMYADVGAAAWTIAVTADTTNGGLAVTFTGQAGTTIRTVAQIRTTEMTF
jgi:hypothetical protein